MNNRMLLYRIIGLVLALGLLTGCCAAPSVAPPVGDPTGDKIATLSSLEKVDDYPLYTMRFHGAYDQYRDQAGASAKPEWACSLFAAMGNAEDMVYGRNFDWQYSPALLLFTDPPDGYASVSMVDIGYLVEEDQVKSLADLSLAEREPLLVAPFWPFDGMNEHGLVVGMAAVPESEMPRDPANETIGSLAIIREMLDHARDVDEAVAILKNYNIAWDGGPALHYLVADASGRAMLVEFYQGKMIVTPHEAPYHLATNHLRTTASGDGGCWRYAALDERLTETEGRLKPQEAVDLLAGVAQEGTQWSIVYGFSTGNVRVVMGREYDAVHTLHLDLADESSQ
ncbi:MAG: linear amide C-N hydrolase [Anaerolineae bacterium]|jgi:hypothetical protein|nr:linear amide C-N hydrolase [Anaerolineae bacterium]